MDLTANDKTRVLQYITEYCQGIYRARTRTEIAKDTYVLQDYGDKVDSAVRRVREIISELVQEGHCILSSNEGVYMTDNPDEIERVAKRILSDAARTREHGEKLMAMALRIRQKPQMTI